MTDFITAFLKHTKEAETPENFFRWGAYATIAAVLRDSVYYDHGLRKTYPNIYVVLLADSAEYRKSGPFQPATDLLNSDGLRNTKVIRGRSSIQAVLDDLSQDIGDKKTGQPIRGGSAILIADELASFFVSDPQLIPLVTDMYDFRENWDYNLKGGKVNIKKLCVTFLAASNETFLREVYTKAAVYGGLLGRTFMIKPNETRPPNDLLDVDLSKYEIESLVKKLVKIRELKGRFTSTPEGRKLYKEWYEKLYNSYKTHPDKTGVTQRIHTGVLKIAMILAANDLSLIIDAQHYQEAILQVTNLRENYGVYSMSTGKSTQAEIGAIFLQALWEMKGVATKRDILVKHWQDFSAEELDQLVNTFAAANLVEVMAVGNEQTYTMTPKCRELFEKKKD
jgi:hypothetical protein